jgi:hypothetical protein
LYTEGVLGRRSGAGRADIKALSFVKLVLDRICIDAYPRGCVRASPPTKIFSGEKIV